MRLGSDNTIRRLDAALRMEIVRTIQKACPDYNDQIWALHEIADALRIFCCTDEWCHADD